MRILETILPDKGRLSFSYVVVLLYNEIQEKAEGFNEENYHVTQQ